MTEKILHYLNVKNNTLTTAYLQELITSYCSNIPWESLSKIIKKNAYTNPADCLRLADEFWTSAILHGTGGTCYESNWAFFCFLQNLGFEGYLTINKITDKSSVHSAIIVKINNKKYIVDIGYPVYAPIPINEGAITIINTYQSTYRSTFIAPNEYIIENFPHPQPYLYHLTDIPVTTKDYLKIARLDYGEKGLFADRIIIRKIINRLPTRFYSEDIPYNIHTLQNGSKLKTFINEEHLIPALNKHFNLDMEIITKAFSVLKKRTQNLTI
jgi:arylamine N-acetyltransferase